MNATKRYQRLRETFRDAGQEHVFRFWERLGDNEKDALLDQLETIDLDLVGRLTSGELTVTPGARKAERRPIEVLGRGEEPEVCTRAEGRARGEELLRQGKVGIYVVAGGQASRLGISAPKGFVEVGPISRRSLFEMHAGQIARLAEKHRRAPPWYIMTSPQNHEETRDYFQGHDHFGLAPEDIIFIRQATLPALDAEGKLILESPGRLFESPNGHGGSFAAFRDGGALDHATARGVKHVFYFQVDNPLVRIADPLFVGLHDLTGSEMSLKVLEKTGPDEKVGVVALEDGAPCVVEYSDLTGEEASRRDAGGRLIYWAGSIALHAFRLDFMRRVAEGAIALPYHVAQRPIASIDEEGRPRQIDGRKFETFVFDALPAARRTLNLEVERSREFAPIKNRHGVDSLDSAREMLVEEYRRWLQKVGIEARGKVEISTRAAGGWRDLEEPLAAWRGKRFEGDLRVERGEGGNASLTPV